MLFGVISVLRGLVNVYFVRVLYVELFRFMDLLSELGVGASLFGGHFFGEGCTNLAKDFVCELMTYVVVVLL